MDQNIIFCFTGTGNSLKVSKDIAKSLPNCTIHHMSRENADADISEYTRVGFIFPVYFLGLPLQVAEFINTLVIPHNFTGYFFAVGTYANFRGNATRQVNTILRQRERGLKYSSNIKMGDNTIAFHAFYDNNPNFEKLNTSYEHDIAKTISEISELHMRYVKREFWPAKVYYHMQISRLSNRDKGFSVSQNCKQCGICVSICPANNIGIVNGQPVFHHKCEQCMACIQLCPIMAIDFNGMCAKRNRYKHPDISVEEISKLHMKRKR